MAIHFAAAALACDFGTNNKAVKPGLIVMESVIVNDVIPPRCSIAVGNELMVSSKYQNTVKSYGWAPPRFPSDNH